MFLCVKIVENFDEGSASRQQNMNPTESAILVPGIYSICTVQAISADFLMQDFKNKLYSEAVVIQFFPADRYKANPHTLYQ